MAHLYHCIRPWLQSAVHAMTVEWQLGEVLDQARRAHAARWSGAAESFVDLTLPGANGSSAYAVTQAGIFGDVSRRRSGELSLRATFWPRGELPPVDLHSCLDINAPGSCVVAATQDALRARFLSRMRLRS